MSADDQPVGAVLIDLDGPLTRLFPDPEHLDLARALAERAATITGMPPVSATDHVQLLRVLAETAPEHLVEIERLAAEAEMGAARDSFAAPGAHSMLAVARAQHRPVGVVSNNCRAAVLTALLVCGLQPFVDDVTGRDGAQVSSLKPAPDLLLSSLRVLGAQAAASVFFGDSVSDVEAGRAAGVPVIGVTESADRARELADAGAVTVVPTLEHAIPLIEKDGGARTTQRPTVLPGEGHP
ncbi:MAG: HAD family phosphatase [Micrococcales bacterium]|nr:HAD family phosphatase [Micrococcales bacterium]